MVYIILLGRLYRAGEQNSRPPLIDWVAADSPRRTSRPTACSVPGSRAQVCVAGNTKRLLAKQTACRLIVSNDHSRLSNYPRYMRVHY
jgi:hypothetical protein